MDKQKNIQIPENLFYQMAMYIMFPDTRTEEAYKIIEKQIYEKLEKQEKRNLYTTYKTANTPEEKEAARMQYLEKIGMKKDFIWSSDKNPFK